MKLAGLAQSAVDKAKREVEPALYAREARIDPDYTGTGLPSVIFVEDLEAGGLSGPFPYLASYAPMAGDLVMLMPRANKSFLILGKVVKS